MSAIIVTPEAATPIVSISPETNTIASDLSARAIAFRIADQVTYDQANQLFDEIQAFSKALEANREEVKAPYWKACKEIDSACKKIQALFQDAKYALAGRIETHKAAENARIAAANRAAQEAAAAAERALYEKAERERAEAIEHAPPGEPVPNIAEPIQVPRVQPDYVQPMLKSSSKVTVKKVAKVLDPARVPFMVNGIKLWKEPDLRAIETLLKAGIAVDGCELVEEATFSAKGARA